MTKILPRFSVREGFLLTSLLLMGLFSLLNAFAQNVPEASATLQESTGGMELQVIRESGAVNPSCLDNYTTWHKSYTYKPNANWNTTMFLSDQYITGTMNGSFLDVNGDGLVDYLYHESANNYAINGGGNFHQEHSCILLNNGHGWEAAYRCVVDVEDDGDGNYLTLKPVYYGDCAQ